MWILGNELHIDPSGNLIDPTDSPYVWLSQKVEGDNIEANSLIPEIELPLTTSGVIPLLQAMKKCLKHNYLPSLLSVAAAIMSLHYECVLKMYDGCPIQLLYIWSVPNGEIVFSEMRAFSDGDGQQRFF